MIEDLTNYIENYYKNIKSNDIDKILNVCKNNNYLLKFLILTIKTDISIICQKNEINGLIIKNKKQFMTNIHQKRRQLIKEFGKKISDNGLKKNYCEDTEELMESINNDYISLIQNIHTIDKILLYFNEPKYNIEYSLRILARNSDSIFIEEYSN